MNPERDAEAMRLRAPACSLLAFVLLAGCTMGASESAGPRGDVVDRGEYAGGAGVAVALQNAAAEPFNITLLLRAGGSEIARSTLDVAPGTTYEKWWSLPAEVYEVEMRYRWSADGRASSGTGDAAADMAACEDVTRLAWRLMHVEGTVGSAFEGASCVAAAE